MPPEQMAEAGLEALRVSKWKFLPHFLLFFILLTLLGMKMERKTDYGLTRLERLWKGSSPLFSRVDQHPDGREMARELGVTVEELQTGQFVVEQYLNRLDQRYPRDWSRLAVLADGDYYRYYVGRELFTNLIFAFFFAAVLYLRERMTLSEKMIVSQSARHHHLNEQLEARVQESERIIEKLNNLQSKLVEAEKLASIGRMSATLAHEIRNPLSIIKSSTDIITDDVDEHAGSSAAVGLIRDEVERMDRIISDLLNFARPKPPRLEQHALKSLVRHWLPPIVEEIERDRIQLVPELEDMDAAVLVDPDQLYQVFLNIMWNARDALAGQPNAHLFVRTDVGDDGFARLIVQDTGPGMIPEMLNQVIEPFFTTKTKGTGLGLPVSVQLIRGMGGNLEIDSVLEEGTTVTVYIPLAESRRPAIDSPSDSALLAAARARPASASPRPDTMASTTTR